MSKKSQRFSILARNVITNTRHDKQVPDMLQLSTETTIDTSCTTNSTMGKSRFEINNKTYLLLVDYYSDFIEIDNLTNTTSERIIESCKSQFVRHGIPVQLITDNGPQFSSIKFKEFAKTYSFQHTTSSPHYPQSNRKAEKAVQITKNQTTADKQDIYLALLDIRNTPASGGIGSPAQRLMGRRTNTLIPTARSLLQPQIIDPQQVLQHMQQSKRKQKEYYDQHLPTLKIGEKVMIKDQARWKPATIIQIHSNPRSYVVKTSEGNRYKRNRQHIVRNTNKESQNDEDEEEDNYTHIQQEQEQPDSLLRNSQRRKMHKQTPRLSPSPFGDQRGSQLDLIDTVTRGQLELLSYRTEEMYRG